MANFDDFEQKQADMQAAALYLHYARQIYAAGKAMRQLKVDYQAGTRPTLNAAVNDLHTAAQRTELSQMGVGLETLLLDWETNHPAALGLAP